MEKNTPFKQLSDGAWRVTIWKNQYKDTEQLSFDLKKSFKKNEEWQEQTIKIFKNDLARCINLLNETYRLMVNDRLKENPE